MPKYIFQCPSCNATTHKYVPVSVETVKCICGQDMNRNLPTISEPTVVKELVDPYTNKRLMKDHKEILKARRNDFFKNVEIPRLVEKYSLETCIENKWLVYTIKVN
jgi:hypothetical protein